MRKALLVVNCLSLALLFAPRGVSAVGAQRTAPCAVALANKLEAPSRKSASLAAVAAQYLKAGDAQTASQLLSEALRASEVIEDSLFKAGSLTDIAEFAPVEHLERGLLVARTIKETDSRVWAYAELAERFAQLSRRDRAAEVLARALADAESIPRQQGGEFDRREFEVVRVGRTYARAGLPEQALEIARRVQNPFQRGRILSEAAAAIAEQKQSARAIETAESIYYEVERANALVEVAARLTKVGLKEAASQSLAKARQTLRRYYHGFASDNDEAVKRLVAIALGYANNGQRERALAALSEAAVAAPSISKPTFREAGLTEVVGGYLHLGLPEQALSAARKIVDVRWRAPALAEVARGMLKAGDKSGAFGLLSEVERLVEGFDCSFEKPLVLPNLSDPSRPPQVLKFSQCRDEKAGALTTAAEVYLAGGLVEKAVEVFNLAVSTALPNADEYDADRTWRGLVDGFIAAGRYELALETATKINYTSRRLAAIAAVELAALKADGGAGVGSQKIFSRLGCGSPQK